MQATIDVSCNIFVCCFYKKNYQSLYELKNISLIKNLSILYIKKLSYEIELCQSYILS